jgi:hypothetical protein
MTQQGKSDHTDKWSKSDERKFIEDLLYQRVNVLLTLFAAVIAGALQVKVQSHLTIILALGAVLCLVLAPSVVLLHHKLNDLIELVREDEEHPASIVYRRIVQKGCLATLHMRGVDRNMVGYVLPVACVALLLLGAWLSLNGTLKVPSATSGGDAGPSSEPFDRGRRWTDPGDHSDSAQLGPVLCMATPVVRQYSG